MSVGNSSREIVIHGTTGAGKTFRPSDWAERLCGILSSFDKSNRLAYHEWVRPILIDKVRCVAVDKQLEDINPAMFRFLMDFAADNDLRVLDGAEAGRSAEAAVPQAEPAGAKAETEKPSGISAPDVRAEIREIEAAQAATAFAALSVLRPGITDVGRFVEQVHDLQKNQAYRLFGVFEEGKTNAVAVCGFRLAHNFSYGRYLDLEDIVTVPQARNRGYASRLLAKLADIAREEGAVMINGHLHVGSDRVAAHRLYYQHGFEITSHYFLCRTDQFRSSAK
ncbi:GNAT family N-acetyltransferase [Neisseria leonii]|uniref:GNAT family N-acetyltransferase n=1 Tax=Neisseria leonii TaxID=2995413 RepID=A0A9X4E5U1_9NEIS|nr:GNAT family N-acetyltransferase [Neisseria sp. 51.81]MDD9327962.1 GNAT family N-acetyltransferase [Neisseria sp. 51.81]